MDSEVFRLVVTEIMDDRHHRPQRESIRLVRERYSDLVGVKGIDRRGIVAIEFDGVDGSPYRAVWGVDRRRNGSWRVAGGASSRHRYGKPADVWVNGGSWASGGSGVSTGIWIADPQTQIARITDPHGRSMEDTVESGVALFIWKGDFNLRASTLELLGSDANVLWSGPFHRQSWETS